MSAENLTQFLSEIGKVLLLKEWKEQAYVICERSPTVTGTEIFNIPDRMKKKTGRKHYLNNKTQISGLNA